MFDMEFNPADFVSSLEYMGKGMLGIFIVIFVIVGITLALNRLTGNKK